MKPHVTSMGGIYETLIGHLSGTPCCFQFFILESNRTFTGNPKPLYFAENQSRFSTFLHKIVYRQLPSDDADPNPWTIEALHRDTLTQMINSELSSPHSQPLVIFADVDEIPSAHSIRLLQTCDAPSPLHLQLRNFVYSFEWPLGLNSWRAQVHKWVKANSRYMHSKSGDVALADAGWHCSFCFRTLDEFVLKMKGYSHSDRIGGDVSLLSHERIQRVICEGKDIFNMLPEAYSYKDLLAWMTPEPSKSVIGVPLYVLRNPDKFKFLLPDGCLRES
ncbi:unnamed protein product [Somion occarium]|uniref:Beta-1,4-mannosyl-glycoprotein beta-1,4-N-acetylglucosaminyltransferase n=1 Tax=Somion occarium TaxID=3059160 RepID=A0ABP1CRF6_9APHY